jgi:hypothetical protein
MLLRDNQDLFNTIKALSGVNDFTTEETQNLVDLTNRRLTMAYNTSPMWDRYVVVSEKRNLSSFKLEGTTSRDGLYYKYATFTYTIGKTCDFFVPVNQDNSNKTNVCFFKNTQGEWVLGTYSSYAKDAITNKIVGAVSPIALATQQDEDSNGNVIEYDSPAEVKEWGNLDVSITAVRITKKTTVSYDETHEVLSSASARSSKETIQDFIRIHDNQSFLKRSATEYDFYVDSFGANVLNGSVTDNEIYVTYKKPIVNQTTGVVISSLTSGQQIPLEFFNYTAHGTYADFLRMDGQHDKAAFEEEKANMFLATELELERIDIINNNNSLNHKISTYVNRSTR